ncbi:MAG: hypothetical protein ACRES8_09615 [Nevskiaceae bacterium]
MRRPIRFITHAAAAAALLCAAAAPASTGEATMELDTAPTGEQMALDLVLVRPLSLAGTVIGTAIFVVALPFNALTLNFKDPARRLILEPAKYTFVRKLGDLE